MKRVPFTISIILLLCFYANAQSEVDRGVAQDGKYTNFGFRFTYNYPKDWVVHGQATDERLRELGREVAAQSGKLSKESVDVALKNTYQLLTLFRHPVGTPGITFNPAILVLAEKISHAPGITNGKHYLLNMRPLMPKPAYEALLKDPMEYSFGGSQFFRDDYAVETSGLHLVQSYFATVVDAYALVFIFLGEDQKSVDEMAKTMETFDRAPLVRRGVTTIIGSPPPRKPH